MTEKLVRRWLRGLEVDLRSLALLRVAIGACVLADLLLRVPQIDDFYTDNGVIPRDLLVRHLGDAWVVTLHIISGQWVVELGLFLVAIVFALGLIAGYRTRLCAIVSWFLLTSVQMRNGPVLHGGDVLLRVVLVWCMFVPLNGRFSLDRTLNPNAPVLPTTQLSPATVALLLQVCVVYWFAAADKMHPVWLTERTAIYYALSLDAFATPLGKWLLNYPELLGVMSIGTVLLEYFGPLLALSPVFSGPLRLLVAGTFIAFHAGLGASMRLALFPWICAAAWSVFLPGMFWNAVDRRRARGRAADPLIFFDGECDFCRRVLSILRRLLLLPGAELREAQSDPDMAALMRKHSSWVVQDPEGVIHTGYAGFRELCRGSPVARWATGLLGSTLARRVGERLYRWISTHRAQASRFLDSITPPPPTDRLPLFANFLVIACLSLLVWGLTFGPDVSQDSAYGRSRWRLASLTTLGQRWALFSPYPAKDNGWFVMEGTRKDGSRVDVWDGGVPSETRPADIAASYRNTQWVKYLVHVRTTADSLDRRYFGRYLCLKWNKRHPQSEQVTVVSVNYMLELTPPPGQPVLAPQRLFVIRYDCQGKPEVDPVLEPSRTTLEGSAVRREGV